jgi:hypothetical protein
MSETWLRTNRRAIWFGCIPPLAIALVGLWPMLQADGGGWTGLRWLGTAICLIGAASIAMLMRELRRPRIAYRDGSVLFYLQSGAPIAVPVGIVEAFFLGQGPANLPASIDAQQRTTNLVARLAQRQTDWANRDVKPALGQWRDGYVTFRGTWCEPLNNDVIRRLNQRLKQVQTQAKQDAKAI